MKQDIFIINLPYRTDRQKHSINQFKFKKNIFNPIFITPQDAPYPNISFWNTIKKIINNNIDRDFIIICEDDHLFTKNFNENYLNESINNAAYIDADILLGGVSWIDKPIQVKENMFWVNAFNGLQFCIIFKKMYSTILSADFTENDFADFKISELTENIFVIHPFISIQKEFGYSDVTPQNNEKDRVKNLFISTDKTLKYLKKVKKFYSNGK